MTKAEQIDTVVIGSGQAGLASSYYLTQYKRDHVVLEKGEVGNSWRRRWDSFNMLTPNWMLQLPGFWYDGDDPDGFLTRNEMIGYMEQYAQSFQAPIRSGVDVTQVKALSNESGYRVVTTQGEFECRNVIVCTGTYPVPRIPDLADQLPKGLTQLHTSQYRNPQQLPDGAVLVVGSGVSGCQIADELNRSGRRVYLCVGRAGRMPSRYRGHDLLWWQVKLGRLEQRVDQLESPEDRFRATLGQYAGGRTLNLHQFARDGMNLLGRLEAVKGSKIFLAPDLHENLTAIEAQVEAALQGLDEFINQERLDCPPADPADNPILTDGLEVELIRELDVEAAGISTVVWSTGFKYDYPWIHLPIGDDYGYPVQWRGVTNYPGLYFVGLRYLYQLKSSFVYGAGGDAAYVTAYLEAHSNADFGMRNAE